MTQNNQENSNFLLSSQSATSPSIKKIKSFYKTQNTIPRLLNIDDERIPEQKLKDYYIKLQNVFNDQNGKKKEPIEIEQLFDEFMGQSKVRKVLIKGSAGMGKSTFLSFVSWKWGEGQLFQKTFSCTFRVPLKELLTKQIFEEDFSELNMLTKLIFHQFKKDGNHVGLVQSEIKNLLEQSESILLLLDGYDEISSFYGRQKFKQIKNFIDFVISKQSKFHVLMTSRPNSIGQIETKFQRNIENLGLDMKQAKKYIDKFFHENKQARIQSNGSEKKVNSAQTLKSLLVSNHNVREVTKTPINLFMLCFVVSQNQQVVSKFKGQFPLSKLYEQTIVWLTKRYKNKKDDKQLETKYLTSDDAFSRTEVQVLKKLAFTKFNEGSQEITSDEIKKFSSSIDKAEELVKVYKFGLLRANGSVKIGQKNSKQDDLNQKIFSFIHLSFQEFMTACYLVDLLSEDPKKYSNFIAYHRNEPRYFMVMKFLAGMINEIQELEDNSQSFLKGKNQKQLKLSFWDSIVCNVDGVLEFGLESKVKLLLHLLGQCNVDSLKVDEFKNLQKVKKLIDRVVIDNVEQWEEHIISSGFLSEEILKKLTSMIDFETAINAGGDSPTKRPQGMLSSRRSIKEQQISWKVNDFRVGSEIITSLINKDEFNKPQIIKKLSTLEKISMQKNYFVLRNISVLLKNVEIFKTTEEILSLISKLQLYLQNKAMHDVSFKILLKIILSEEEGSQITVNKIDQKILLSTQQSTWKVIFQVFEKSKYDTTTFSMNSKSMLKLYQATLSLAKTQSERILLQQNKSKDMIVSIEAFTSNLVPVPEILIEILKVAPNRVEDVIKISKKLLNEDGMYARSGGVELLGQIVKIDRKFVKTCIQLINDVINDKYLTVKMAVFKIFPQMIKMAPEEQALSIAGSFLKNQVPYARECAVVALGELVRKLPNKISEIGTLLLLNISDKIPEVIMRIVSALHECVKVQQKKSSQILIAIGPYVKHQTSRVQREVRRVFKEISKYQKIPFNQFINTIKVIIDASKAQQTAVQSLCEKVKQNPHQFFNLIDCYIQESNPKLRIAASKVLGLIGKAQPRRISQIMPKINQLIKDKQSGVHQEAVQTFKQLFRLIEPKKAYEIVDSYITDANPLCRQAALYTLYEIKQLMTIKDLITKIKPFLTDKEFNVRLAVLVIITKSANLREITQSQVDDLVESLKLTLSDSFSSVQKNCVYALGQLAILKPNRATDIVVCLKPLLADNWQILRAAVLETIVKLSQHIPNQIDFLVEKIQQFLKDENSYIKREATKICKGLFQKNSIKFNLLVDSIKQFVKHNDTTLKLSAIESISQYLKNNPLQGISIVKPYICQYNSQIAIALASSLARSVKISPELLKPIIDNIKVLLSKDQSPYSNEAGVEVFCSVLKEMPTDIKLHIELIKQLTKHPHYYVRKWIGHLIWQQLQFIPFNESIILLTSSQFSNQSMFLGQFPQIAKKGLSGFFTLYSISEKDANKILLQVHKYCTNQRKDYLSDILMNLTLEKILLLDLCKNEIYKFQMREVCKNAILRRLSDPLLSLQMCYKDIPALIELSKQKLFENHAKQILKKLSDEFKNEFVKVKKTKIENLKENNEQAPSDLKDHQQTEKLNNQQGSDSLQHKIAWLNSRIVLDSNDVDENDLSLKIDTTNILARMFMKRVFHNLLGDGDVSQEDTKFIINCIRNNLTTNVKRDGRIVFEDNEYDLQIKQNPQARRQFERIIKAALEQKQELVEQYKTFKPYFPNYNSIKYLSLSASDIETVSSFIDPSKKINHDNIVLSHLQSEDESFCLVQKRNVFGDLYVYKIDSKRLRPFHSTHPEKNDVSFRQRIFGPLKNIEYKITSVVRSAFTQAQIHKIIEDTTRAKTEEGSSDICEIIRSKYLSGGVQATRAKWEILGYKEDSNEVIDIKLGKVEQINTRVSQNTLDIFAKLETAGITDIAIITLQIEKLQKEQPQLAIYYKVFYWTINSYLYSLKNSQNGIGKVNTSFEQENSFIEAGLKAVGGFIVRGVLENVPVIGKFVEELEQIVDLALGYVEQYKFENKRNAIMNIIKARINNGDSQLCTVLQKTTIQIINKKRQKILHPYIEDEDSIIDDFFNALQKKMQAVKGFLIEKEIKPYADDQIVADMAAKDVSHLLSYMIKNWEDIVNDRQKKLEIKLAEGFEEEELKMALKLGRSEGKAGGDCCMIY